MNRRVMVLDDESYIADATATLLRMREDWDLEVCALYSSEEALQRMRRARVDLLITDIRMPGMDGMSLLHEVKRRWPVCEVILLSAYEHFEYAYRATKYPDVTYVLKHDGHQALLEAVEASLARLNANALTDQLLDKARERARAALPHTQGAFIRDLVRGTCDSPERLSEAKRELELPIDVDRPFVMLLVLPHGAHAEAPRARMEQSSLMWLIARAQFPADCHVLQTQPNEGGMLWLAQSEDGDGWMTRLGDMLEGIQDACWAQLDMELSFTYARCEGAADAPVRYARLRAIQSLMSAGGQTQWLLDADNDPLNVKANPTETSPEEANAWRRAYEAGDGRADALLESLLRRLEDCDSLDDLRAMAIYQQLGSQLGVLISRMGLESQQCVELEMNRLYDIRSHRSPRAAAEYLRQVIKRLTQLRRRTVADSMEAVVARVERYIQENLAGDTSLTRLADYARLNASYLSRIYKQVRGRNLMDYISQTKMDCARQLLASSDKRLSDIGSALGFPNPSYFSYFFKRLEGITPREYRELHTRYQ